METSSGVLDITAVVWHHSLQGRSQDKKTSPSHTHSLAFNTTHVATHQRSQTVHGHPTLPPSSRTDGPQLGETACATLHLLLTD